MKNRTKAISAAATILICLGLLAVAGCGSDDSPTDPTTTGTSSLVELEMTIGQTTFTELWETGAWTANPDRLLSTGGIFEGDDVTVWAQFNPNQLSNVETWCPRGCYLVEVNGISTGSTPAELTALLGEPVETDSYLTWTAGDLTVICNRQPIFADIELTFKRSAR